MKDRKVILFDKMMQQVSDLVGDDLKVKKIYYERKGTIFNLEPDNITELIKSQYKANRVLFDNGEFTKNMIIKM